LIPSKRIANDELTIGGGILVATFFNTDVRGTSILSKSPSDHIISINTPISDILTSSIKGLIEGGILLVNSDIKSSDCIGLHVVSYWKADDNILLKLRLSPMFTLYYASMWVALLILTSIHTWS